MAQLSRHAHLANDGLAALGVGVLLGLLGAAAALQLALLDGIGVARLLLNRVGEVIRQLVTELARLHLAHLHLHLGKGNAFLESITTSDADPGSGNSPFGYKTKKIYLTQNSTL